MKKFRQSATIKVRLSGEQISTEVIQAIEPMVGKTLQHIKGEPNPQQWSRGNPKLWEDQSWEFKKSRSSHCHSKSYPDKEVYSAGKRFVP